MTRNDTYTKGWNLDDENSTEVVIEYNATPGTPETGRSYLARPEDYDPGSGDEFEIVSIKTTSGADMMLRADEYKAALAFIESYHEWPDDGPDPDDYYDRLRDDRMTGDAR